MSSVRARLSPFKIKMKYLILKDRRRRVIFSFYERKRRVLISLYKDQRLNPEFRQYIYNYLRELPRDSSLTRVRNRCVLTNRPRAVYRRFGISRIIFRHYAWRGQLIGVRKASW